MSPENDRGSTAPPVPGPLAGYRVLDFTDRLQGPLGTQILGDLGAEVLKVERLEVLTPDGRPVDRYRTDAEGRLDLDYYRATFLAVNRNKKSIAIDLKTETGRKVVRRLVARVDVVYENFRPGVMDRLGFGYAACAAINPGIVYVSASGYGPDGPYAGRRGQDILAQGIGGLAAANAAGDDRPLAVGVPIGDILGGMNGATAALAALLHRDRTGQGQQVQVNLLDSVLASQLGETLFFLNGPAAEPRRETEMQAHPYLPPPYGYYRTRDGYLALPSGQQLAELSELLGLPDLSLDLRFSTSEARNLNRVECDRLLEEALAARTTAEWLELMEARDIYAGPVHTLAQAFADPQVQHNGIIATVDSPTGPIRMIGPPMRLSRTPAGIRASAPLLGQHSREILSLAGFSSDEADQIIDSGVVAEPPVGASGRPQERPS